MEILQVNLVLESIFMCINVFANILICQFLHLDKISFKKSTFSQGINMFMITNREIPIYN